MRGDSCTLIIPDDTCTFMTHAMTWNMHDRRGPSDEAGATERTRGDGGARRDGSGGVEDCGGDGSSVDGGCGDDCGVESGVGSGDCVAGAAAVAGGSAGDGIKGGRKAPQAAPQAAPICSISAPTTAHMSPRGGLRWI